MPFKIDFSQYDALDGAGGMLAKGAHVAVVQSVEEKANSVGGTNAKVVFAAAGGGIGFSEYPYPKPGDTQKQIAFKMGKLKRLYEAAGFPANALAGERTWNPMSDLVGKKLVIYARERTYTDAATGEEKEARDIFPVRPDFAKAALAGTWVPGAADSGAEGATAGTAGGPTTGTTTQQPTTGTQNNGAAQAAPSFDFSAFGGGAQIP